MSSGLGTGSLDGMPGDNGGISRFIVVRFNDDTIPDLKLNITHVSMDTINTQWLRRLCRELRGEQTHRRRLRFIGPLMTRIIDQAGGHSKDIFGEPVIRTI